jgi:hypothetical protein
MLKLDGAFFGLVPQSHGQRAQVKERKSVRFSSCF